jgi:hypothetical protein
MSSEPWLPDTPSWQLGDREVGSEQGALALVESPAQLLNVIELSQHQDDLAGLKIAVLAPAAGLTRTQLRSMMGLARDAGHAVSWHEPRLGGMAVARTVRALAGELSGVQRLIAGDPYSGVIQVIISVTKLSEVTIVDDGTALLEFARQWVAGEHLARWNEVATPGQRRQIAQLARDQISGTVRRRLSPGSGCRLRLFTCMQVDVPLVRTIQNDFSWVRARHPAPQLKSGADLVGSSLVELGVVKADSYLDGVENLITRYKADRYFAHRKEADWKLDLIERIGIKVVRPALPLEIIVRRGPTGRTVVSFPSTVVHTLPIVLAGSGVEVVVCDIPMGWYQSKATVRADEFLGRVSTTAQRSYGLRAVAG